MTQRRTTTFNGRRPLTEDDLWKKTTFDGRRPGRRHLMEDDIWRKTTFDRRRPLTEDDLWRKTTFDGRRPLMEDNLWWKTTFDGRWPDGRWPLMEDTLWWKTTFDGRRQWGRTQKQRGLAHCWNAHGAGHIPLCGIFYIAYSNSSNFTIVDNGECIVCLKILNMTQPEQRCSDCT